MKNTSFGITESLKFGWIHFLSENKKIDKKSGKKVFQKDFRFFFSPKKLSKIFFRHFWMRTNKSGQDRRWEILLERMAAWFWEKIIFDWKHNFFVEWVFQSRIYHTQFVVSILKCIVLIYKLVKYFFTRVSDQR